MWSENGGEVTASTTVNVVTPLANLTPMGGSMTPGSPMQAPGTAFSVIRTRLLSFTGVAEFAPV